LKEKKQPRIYTDSHGSGTKKKSNRGFEGKKATTDLHGFTRIRNKNRNKNKNKNRNKGKKQPRIYTDLYGSGTRTETRTETGTRVRGLARIPRIGK
jgi:hypothetical protein